MLSGIVAALVGPASGGGPGPATLPLVDAARQLRPAEDGAETRSLNAAFLLTAARALPESPAAEAYLEPAAGQGALGGVASSSLDALRRAEEEFAAAREDSGFAGRARALADYLAGEAAGRPADEVAEPLWEVFFPEGVGVRGRERERAEALRRRRTIEVTGTAPAPIGDPAGQVLFTANALLTIPPAGRGPDDLDVADEVREGVRAALGEPQRFWYDHPVQIGVEPSGSELLYGIRAMERGMAFEKERGTVPAEARLRLALSVSTTHLGLEPVARRYLEDEILRLGGLRHLEVYAFGESDAGRLVADVLAPAAARFLGREDASGLLGVFGVRGPYGRHHSFGKAIAAHWHVLIDPRVVATFKTDLDHSWPQERLVAETDRSLLEHVTFPLWGGSGVDREGRSLDLAGMAGALVNEADLDAGLYTPDVPFHEGPLAPDHVRILLFSELAGAITDDREGLKAVADPFTGCFISRIPVTGASLRLALRAAAAFARGDEAEGSGLVTLGAEQLARALAFTAGSPSELAERYRRERAGWDLSYETPDALEARLRAGDPEAADLASRARRLVSGCAVGEPLR